MLQKIAKFFAPPVFPDDEEKTRLARLLNMISITVMLLVMMFSVPALVMTPELGRIAIEFVLLVLAIGILVMLRRGSVREAGFLLSLIIWSMVTYGTYEASGFRGSIMSAYFGIILIAELMLGAWAGAAFGIISILATGLMALADGYGLMPPAPDYATLSTFWIEFSVVVVGVVGLLSIVMNSLQQTLQRARSNERELALKVLEVQDFAQKAIEASEFKSRLIARVSHELRTPLGAMLGMAEMLYLATYGPLNEEQKGLMQRIIENSRQLDQVFSELLEQSQIETGQLTLREIDVTPAGLLRQVDALYRPRAEQKGLTYRSRLDPSLPDKIICDPARVDTILANLINNAIKFTPKGSVNVEFFCPDPEHWALRVTDTGIGIPPEARQHIFEPFRQVDEGISRQFGGVGLGLSIVSELAQVMKGKIDLQSQVGQGSQFTVTFPLQKKPVESNHFAGIRKRL